MYIFFYIFNKNRLLTASDLAQDTLKTESFNFAKEYEKLPDDIWQHIL